MGREHPMFRAFLPLPNFALGYNETKIIVAVEVIHSIVAATPMWPSFDNGHHITQIVDACLESARLRRWVDIPLVRGSTGQTRKDP